MGAITRLAAMPGTKRLLPLLALLFVLAALASSIVKIVAYRRGL